MTDFAIRLRLSEDPGDSSLEYRRGWNAALREVDRITRAAAPHSDAAQPSARETATFNPLLAAGLGRCLACGHHSMSHHAEKRNCLAFTEEMERSCECVEYVQPQAPALFREAFSPPVIDLPDHDACDCEACRAAKGCECTEVPCAAFCPARGGT